MRQWIAVGWMLAFGLGMAGCGDKKETAGSASGSMAALESKVADLATYGKGSAAKICPVSHEAIGGDMGKPYVYELPDGKKITLCCAACKAGVKKDPAKYAAFLY